LSDAVAGQAIKFAIGAGRLHKNAGTAHRPRHACSRTETQAKKKAPRKPWVPRLAGGPC